MRLRAVMRDADALGLVLLPEAGLRAGVRHAQPAHKAMSIDQPTLNTRDSDQFGHFVNHHEQILVYGIYGRRQLLQRDALPSTLAIDTAHGDRDGDGGNERPYAAVL